MAIIYHRPEKPTTCGESIVENILAQLKAAHETLVICNAKQDVKAAQDCFEEVNTNVGKILLTGKDESCDDELFRPYRTDAAEWEKLNTFEHNAIVDRFGSETLGEPISPTPKETVFELKKIGAADTELAYHDMWTLIELSVDHINNRNCQLDVIRLRYDVIGAYNQSKLCIKEKNTAPQKLQRIVVMKLLR